jgi:hypothetical protein
MSTSSMGGEAAAGFDKAGLDRGRRAAYLRDLRAGLDRETLGLSTRIRAQGLTQQELVDALGSPVGERQWRNLERCEKPWPRHIADAYARLAGLEGRDLRTFYGVVGHRRLAQSPSPELSEAERFMLGRAFARCTPWYVVDELWDVRALNRAMARMVPHLIPGMNVMEYVLTHPVAQLALVDWYEQWATPMVHQLRSTLAVSTGERREGLLAVARACTLANPRIAELWNQGFDTRLSPNGDRRGMRPADPTSPDGLGEPVEILLYGMSPLNRPLWRAMWIFAADHRCELCRPAGYEDGEQWFPAAATPAAEP